MKMVRWLQVSLFITLLMSLSVFFIPDATAQEVHALLVVRDDEADIGVSVDIDRQRIEALLLDIENKNVCRVNKRVLKGSEGMATADRMKRWIKSVRPANNDVIFVYYSGHGAMVRNETFIATQAGYSLPEGAC